VYWEPSACHAADSGESVVIGTGDKTLDGRAAHDREDDTAERVWPLLTQKLVVAEEGPELSSVVACLSPKFLATALLLLDIRRRVASSS
jgi:hypothetical protein